MQKNSAKSVYLFQKKNLRRRSSIISTPRPPSSTPSSPRNTSFPPCLMIGSDPMRTGRHNRAQLLLCVVSRQSSQADPEVGPNMLVIAGAHLYGRQICTETRCGCVKTTSFESKFPVLLLKLCVLKFRSAIPW